MSAVPSTTTIKLADVPDFSQLKTDLKLCDSMQKNRAIKELEEVIKQVRG